MATDHRRETGTWGTDDDSVPPRDESRLVATLVRYEDGPDKCTIAPPDPDESERLTTWLTANRSAFVSLAERR